jgi:hypothetical protein
MASTEPAHVYGFGRPRGETTKLEWVMDFRFFPTIRDEVFGYVLHPVDLATNKVAAAYWRREPRDVVDLLTIHERILPLGAVGVGGQDIGIYPGRRYQRNSAHSALYRSRPSSCRQRSAD